MIRAAKKRVEKGKFEIMDFRKLTFKGSTFDGIWCMAGLINTEKGDIDSVIKEFHRVLKDKGVVYLALKEGKNGEIVKRKKYNDIPIPYVYYSIHEIEQLLKNYNFVLLESVLTQDEDERWIEIFAQKTKRNPVNSKSDRSLWTIIYYFSHKFRGHQNLPNHPNQNYLGHLKDYPAH